MSHPDREPQARTLAPLVLVTQVGLAASIPIVAGVAAGIYVKDRLGGAWSGVALAGCIFLGIAAAAASVYRVIAPFLKD